MSDSNPIDDARALLDTLLSSGWRDAHVVSGGTEIFIALEGGRANPMRSKAGAALALPVPSVENQVEITAPHVATFVDAVDCGEIIIAGQKIATIRVLEVEEDVIASVDGTVADVRAKAGDLLEFKAPILTIDRAA
jgi:biotin carboxyl carrier protein